MPAVQGLTDRTSLVIRSLTTGDKLQFRVRAYNMAGPSAAATLAQAVTIREIMREGLGGTGTSRAPAPVFMWFCCRLSERPKILLPRNLRQTLIRRVGDTVNLVIPFQVQLTPPVVDDIITSLLFRYQNIGTRPSNQLLVQFPNNIDGQTTRDLRSCVHSGKTQAEGHME